MDPLLQNFEKLKISAFSKYSSLPGDIGNVTLGPQSSSILNSIEDIPKTPTKNIEIRTQKRRKSVSKQTSPLIYIVKKLEEERKEELQQTIEQRYLQFESFSKRINNDTDQQWVHKQQSFIQHVEDVERGILQTIMQEHNYASKQQEKLFKHNQEMAQMKQQYEQQLARKREAQKVLNELLDTIKKQQLEFRVTYQEILAVIKSCESSDQLKVALGDKLKILKNLQDNFEEITARCKTYKVKSEDLVRADTILNDLKHFKQKVQDIVLKINAQNKADKAAVEVPATITKKEEKIEKAAVETSAPITSLTQCISPFNLKRYVEIQQFLSQYSNSFIDLVNDEQLKQFRFDCKKAVNIPVNAISGVNADHLRDKYTKLNGLLAGKTILAAEKQINASRHPQGVPFCMNLLAKKFVLQGDLMISSNPEAAFCYATIIVSLWNDFPDFGKLVLGYFYTQCPYVIPFYIPKTEELSTEEYYTRLGYRYVNGQIEKQDKFLKRMTGFLRLYFAIFITKPKKEQPRNPHDMRNAWSYLASLLKLEPVLDITATCLHVFLETVGMEMERVYGNSFRKLIRIIQDKFLPALKMIDTGGPVTRLEVLLQNYEKENHFNKPNGILSPNFW